jgi:outer membrane protein OmpA-like peptidoglycan-associated protein
MIGPSALWISAVIGVIALTGCKQHIDAPPIAAAGPPPLPPPAPAPPPSADDQLQAQLSQLSAAPSSQGWTMSLNSGKFTRFKVRFDKEDAAHLAKVAELMKSSPNLRLQIGAYPGNYDSKLHRKDLAQIHANSVLRDLTDQGADQARIQAFAVDRGTQPAAGPLSNPHKVEIIFSNAEGEFRQAAASQ